MKKLLLVIAALFCLSLPAHAEFQGPIYCNATAISTTISSATTTAVIPAPASGNARIFICGYSIVTGTVSGATLKLEYGTGSTCGTGTTAMTPAAPLASSTISGDNSMMFRGLVTAPGTGVCAVSAGTTNSETVQIYYAQQ